VRLRACAGRPSHAPPLPPALKTTALWCGPLRRSGQFHPRRMNKSQQMRWSRNSADLLLQVRCAVYNGTLGSGFGHRFNRLANTDVAFAQAACSPQCLDSPGTLASTPWQMARMIPSIVDSLRLAHVLCQGAFRQSKSMYAEQTDTRAIPQVPAPVRLRNEQHYWPESLGPDCRRRLFSPIHTGDARAGRSLATPRRTARATLGLISETFNLRLFFSQ
jgi:hypothetical protein